MFFSRRKRRQRQQQEIAASLSRTRDAAEAGALELRLCRAMLDLKDEQLAAAIAVNDAVSARAIVSETLPLLAESQRLIAREKALNRELETQLARIETITQEK